MRISMLLLLAACGAPTLEDDAREEEALTLNPGAAYCAPVVAAARYQNATALVVPGYVVGASCTDTDAGADEAKTFGHVLIDGTRIVKDRAWSPEPLALPGAAPDPMVGRLLVEMYCQAVGWPAARFWQVGTTVWDCPCGVQYDAIGRARCSSDPFPAPPTLPPRPSLPTP